MVMKYEKGDRGLVDGGWGGGGGGGGKIVTVFSLRATVCFSWKFSVACFMRQFLQRRRSTRNTNPATKRGMTSFVALFPSAFNTTAAA